MMVVAVRTVVRPAARPNATSGPMPRSSAGAGDTTAATPTAPTVARIANVFSSIIALRERRGTRSAEEPVSLRGTRLKFDYERIRWRREPEQLIAHMHTLGGMQHNGPLGIMFGCRRGCRLTPDRPNTRWSVEDKL